MIITKTLLNRYRTAKCGFTKTQLEALGVPWPPPKGWLNKINGTEIDDIQFNKFRIASYKNSAIQNQSKPSST